MTRYQIQTLTRRLGGNAARRARAILGLQEGFLQVWAILPPWKWVVRSTMSGHPRFYRVERAFAEDGTEYWFCNCPDFQKRHAACKHIWAVRFSLGQRA